jgi:hypothetical protein
MAVAVHFIDIFFQERYLQESFPVVKVTSIELAYDVKELLSLNMDLEDAKMGREYIEIKERRHGSGVSDSTIAFSREENDYFQFAFSPSVPSIPKTAAAAAHAFAAAAWPASRRRSSTRPRLPRSERPLLRRGHKSSRNPWSKMYRVYHMFEYDLQLTFLLTGSSLLWI